VKPLICGGYPRGAEGFRIPVFRCAKATRAPLVRTTLFGNTAFCSVLGHIDTLALVSKYRSLYSDLPMILARATWMHWGPTTLQTTVDGEAP
jgi:hypothetical protein